MGPLSRKQNLYIMDRRLKGMICDAAHVFTNSRASYPEIVTALHDGVANLPSYDIMNILCLKRGLLYIMNYHGPINLDLFKELNAITTPNSINPGHFATVPMSVSGTSWQPPKPDENYACELIDACKNMFRTTFVKAITLMIQFDRYQFFWNGNKRTAWLVANYYLLSHGDGLLNIPQSKKSDWTAHLKHYYESGESQGLISWLIDNCIECPVMFEK